ncbi:MAG: 23S rRNA (adenine(2503)-C(2))-methyltransferase RlmN [Candidatus Promineifilaceae bacterium]
MAKDRLDLYDLRREELITLLGSWSFSEYHAERLWEYLYRRQATSLASMPDLRPDLLERLRQETILSSLQVRRTTASADGLTQKDLLELTDGQLVETVLMRFDGRTTACVSTQVGCAMGCVFCATGQMGFVRHLRPGEIVAQVMHAARASEPGQDQLRNIVLMGMGEPLHNYEATMAAIDIMTDDRGLAFASRHITLSTVGLPDGIRRLAEEGAGVNLAVSLHAATEEARSALVPINRRWSLDQILDACRYYVEQTGRRIFFEWALIDGANDSAEQAHAIGQLLQGIDAHVNLIPLNPTAGYDGQPAAIQNAWSFQNVLAGHGLPSTIRQRRGIDIDAGCGQLRARETAAGRI